MQRNFKEKKTTKSKKQHRGMSYTSFRKTT